MDSYTLTPADFADTGQWRLIIELRQNGLKAWLENTLHPEVSPQFLCDEEWHPDRNSLLKNLEEAVYHHPRLLDDFATKIVSFERNTIFIPSSILDSHGAEFEIYREIYSAEPGDVIYDRKNEITAAWSMGPGIKSFLLRTFPGARMTNHLMERVMQLKKDNQGPTLYIEQRISEVDFILLQNENLISASTHIVENNSQIDSVVNDIYFGYGYSPDQLKIKRRLK